MFLNLHGLEGLDGINSQLTNGQKKLLTTDKRKIELTGGIFRKIYWQGTRLKYYSFNLFS